MLNSMSGILEISLDKKAEKDTQNFKQQWQMQPFCHDYEVRLMKREFRVLK